MKNQKTMMRKTMYHSQRQPWRSAMLFMRRKVPERMPEVSAKASFCGVKWLDKPVSEGNTDAHHFAELYGGLLDLLSYAYCDL